jgi:hypothetical protein
MPTSVAKAQISRFLPPHGATDALLCPEKGKQVLFFLYMAMIFL